MQRVTFRWGNCDTSRQIAHCNPRYSLKPTLPPLSTVPSQSSGSVRRIGVYEFLPGSCPPLSRERPGPFLFLSLLLRAEGEARCFCLSKESVSYQMHLLDSALPSERARRSSGACTLSKHGLGKAFASTPTSPWSNRAASSTAGRQVTFPFRHFRCSSDADGGISPKRRVESEYSHVKRFSGAFPGILIKGSQDQDEEQKHFSCAAIHTQTAAASATWHGCLRPITLGWQNVLEPPCCGHIQALLLQCIMPGAAIEDVTESQLVPNATVHRLARASWRDQGSPIFTGTPLAPC